jgi:L-rhamnose mutarotase
MNRVAFKMQLNTGCYAEYKKRHDEIWPELSKLLKKTGVRDYSIFLDEDTNILFATLKVNSLTNLDILPALDIMKKWWVYMADIMATNPDHSPISKPLTEVFYLP